MLQIKNLSIRHKKDLRPLIENLSLVLNDGDKAALIGEEGNGKSTFLKWIYDTSLIDGYAEYEGEVIGRTSIGYLEQELLAEDKAMTIYEYLCEDPNFFYLTFNELSEIAVKLRLSVDLFYSEQIIDTLSGGEKIKIQMAKLMAKKPSLYLLDEPSNDIDIKTLEWLETFINEQTVPVLYISHDEMLLESTANMIIHIERLKRKTVTSVAVAKCGYKEYITNYYKNYERQKQLARKQNDEYKHQQEKWRQIYQEVDHAQRVITRQAPSVGRLLKKKMHCVKSQQRRFEKQKENMLQMPEIEENIFLDLKEIGIANSKTVLEISLEKLMADGKVIADNIDLKIYGPQHICITGNNGVGKTTLMKLIADELMNRNDISAFYMPQDYNILLNSDKTPVDFLSETFSKEETARIRSFLGCVKYTPEEMLRPIKNLSGGQKAKLFFIKMSLGEYNVLILDEPTRNLSPLSNPVVCSVLKNFKGVIISVSHDRKFIKEVCDKVYVLTEKGLFPESLID